MNQLYSFLSRIQKGALITAPYTKRSTWGKGLRSPYKVIMIAGLIRGLRKGAFKNGLVTIEQIRPYYEEIASVLIKDFDGADSKVVQPFWYLGTGQPKVWSLIPAEGASDDLIQAILARKQIKTMGVLKELVAGAEISTNDFELLCDPLAARSIARFIAGEYLREHPELDSFLSMTAP